MDMKVEHIAKIIDNNAMNFTDVAEIHKTLSQYYANMKKKAFKPFKLMQEF